MNSEYNKTNKLAFFAIVVLKWLSLIVLFSVIVVKLMALYEIYREGGQSPSVPSSQLPASTNDNPADKSSLSPKSSSSSLVSDAPREGKVVEVKAGDNTISILERLGLERVAALQAISSSGSLVDLSKITPGNRFILAPDGSIVYDISPSKRLVIHKDHGRWVSSLEVRPLKNIVNKASFVVENSVFYDGVRSGVSEGVLFSLADIFAWDLDFGRDIMPGARVDMIISSVINDRGDVVKRVIEAAKIDNAGRTLEVVRYKNAKGAVDYYTPSGKSVRKAFLRSPVKYTRISSKFNAHRHHPILGYTRAHKGVDFAAPYGTPVRATADGVIIFKGRHGGHGNFIRIRHKNGYITGYAHLSRFAHIRKGSRVHQGDIIAYVGSTGLSTGPHLHYEVTRFGRFLNPLTLRSAVASSISHKELPRFKAQSGPLLAQLSSISMASR